MSIELRPPQVHNVSVSHGNRMTPYMWCLALEGCGKWSVLCPCIHMRRTRALSTAAGHAQSEQPLKINIQHRGVVIRHLKGASASKVTTHGEVLEACESHARISTLNRFFCSHFFCSQQREQDDTHREQLTQNS